METARRSAKGGKNMRVKKLTAIGLSVVCAAGMLTAVSYTHLDVYKRQVQDRF